ncbi:atrial natriuretic peptide receptor 1-like [Stegodyphus dumicola]|uniref:atrial natriuretic peptide receptor 1-like n=1 Tax=Stegodyphus dumicola TaxID=202533 RepID=UPI0015AFFF24|nr:atrial natriuretic peptide receptor 1-like [Stegodyphus dumicola]
MCLYPGDMSSTSTLDLLKQSGYRVRSREELLWKAPELLRDPNAPPAGTQKSDIYSFGIILYEIIGRNGPYGQIEKTPSEIIKRIMRRDQSPPFRPQVAKLEDSFDCIVDCMQECWAEDPETRPDFKSIRTKLRPMRKGM